ncbi:MAG TPA: response regulator transcription factor [Candidatus Cryptobacteroides excrementigallinarum]|nr:response regulator transcription factor [Candidatus Cryptobacteroides excrementigallinarum]
MTEVLIVEDEADILDILSFNLENAGYKVLAASSAEDGIRLLGPDTALILLDVMLPGMSGFQMARQLRKENRNHIPIIFLTARGTENDILTGFSAGGDDYISKPFSINEVLARVKAVLRRSGGETSSPDTLDYGGLHIDLASETAVLAGEPLSLSRKEFDLLALLARHPDTYFSRAVLISSLWKDAPYVLDRTVDVHIARIRGKLGKYRDLIKNKTGFGYYVDSHYVVQE